MYSTFHDEVNSQKTFPPLDFYGNEKWQTLILKEKSLSTDFLIVALIESFHMQICK